MLCNFCTYISTHFVRAYSFVWNIYTLNTILLFDVFETILQHVQAGTFDEMIKKSAIKRFQKKFLIATWKLSNSYEKKRIKHHVHYHFLSCICYTVCVLTAEKNQTSEHYKSDRNSQQITNERTVFYWNKRPR